ncbi:hypothetical protein AB7250_19040 [Providencia stuartii]|uniref:hypothetical protein n=1 Tax=Providencia TaxID=586 RepID=UPI0013A7A87D|nr:MULTISPECIES: hypothetical protein [Providencia]MBQ0458597.1 hypothetical protein [Providencia stuartii]MDN7225347.1 hypothetical protein [Providencia stuartii]QIB30871.1 hypothetical protein G3A48_14590 [Providencia stuartii]
MSIQHLELEVRLLSAQLTRQEQQIVELQKQLTDMQAKVSCELDALSADILRVHATLNSNEEAYQRILSTLQANCCNQ